MPLLNGFGLVKKLPTKKALNPKYFYIKTVKGRQLARMHSKALIEKFEAQERELDRMKTRRDALMADMNALIAKHQKLSPQESKKLRKKLVTFETDLSKIVAGELEFTLQRGDSTKTSSSGMVRRLHEFNNLKVVSDGYGMVIERLGLVEKGFGEKVLAEANILKRIYRKK